MGKFSDYEKEISTQLQPLRSRLSSGNIPVASLPKEAAKFTQRYPGSLRVLVGHSYRGKRLSGGGQEREIDVSVYIRLANRYEDEPQPPIDANLRAAAVDWVEEEVLKLLLGFLPYTAASSLALKSANLVPPEEGEWQKVINFVFLDQLDFYQEPTPILDSAGISETYHYLRTDDVI